MKRLLPWLGLVALMLVISTSAQTNAVKAVVHPRPIAPLVNYVLTNGTPALAKPYITRLMHLGDNDVPVIQKGWETRNDGMNHLVAVSKANPADVMLLFYNNQGLGVAWLTSPSGELRYTVKFNHPQHTAEVVPNEKAAASFESEKAYMLYRMMPAPKKTH